MPLIPLYIGAVVVIGAVISGAPWWGIVLIAVVTGMATGMVAEACS